MGGTLLGLTRTGDFIPHDDDLDIGILIENWNPKITEEFQKAGFQWSRQLGTKELGLEYTFFKNGIQLDIFFWYEEKDKYTYCAWWKSNHPLNIVKLQFDLFELKLQNYPGHGEFLIPNNPEHWLEQIYGKDWRIPNSDWHWCASVKNIVQAPFKLGRKSICLGMIVKNEEKIIRECLEAVKSHIDNWLIIDTGSTDKTKDIILEVLKDIPGELIDRPWVNFGYNRTEMMTLTRSKADFTLAIDADEIMHISKLDRETLISDSYYIQYRDGTFEYWYNSLLNNLYEWKSVGVTHEYWSAKDGYLTEYMKHAYIEHKCSGDYRGNKTKNDLALLLQGHIDEPNNVRYLFYLGNVNRDLCEFDEAIKWYTKRVEAGGWHEEVFYAKQMILLCHIRKGSPFEIIIEAMLDAYYYNPKSAEPLYEVMRYCREKKLGRMGYWLGKIAEQIPQPTDIILFMRPNVYRYQIKDELSIFAYYLGKYKEAEKLMKQILEEKYYHASDKERIEKNYQFAIDALKKGGTNAS